ncbi:yrdC domain-containing protein, mitochondrial [Boleophthalmus pectinirostris]|uniref:yrdC domain-containing protein, mitochondrial n=1 Tax=Boleophthalmus pectinirostris TaxID=150288 RepID=UPI000A1C6D8A|nr:yrdC domain-containing protein, mitochondrial [Boleophthalmus pectinirostris]
MTCFTIQLRVYRAVFRFFTFRGIQSLAASHQHEIDMCKELKTKVLRLLPQTSNGPSAQQYESHSDGADVLGQTVKALQEGHVVALPTDTIYGLACLAQNSEAVCKIYDIKGRNAQKPLAICVGEVQDIQKYCKVKVKEELLDDLLPGPVTLVFERTDFLNRDLNPFTSLVGVRIPDHPFMRRLCQMCGEPLALTSANISSQTSTVAAHEFKELWPKLAVVVDGGPIGDESRLGSTVVDLSVLGKYRIIRQGCALPSTLDVLQHKYGLSEDAAGE